MTRRTRPQGARETKKVLVAESSNGGSERASCGRCTCDMAVTVRLLVVAALALAGMGVAANATLMSRAHIEPGCSMVHASSGGSALEACHAGWFKGYPNLVGKGCTAVGVTPKLQYWSCPQPS